MTDQKLNLNINIGEIPYLEVTVNIDNKLVHDSKIENDGSNRLDEIHQFTEVFSVADRKMRHVKIP